MTTIGRILHPDSMVRRLRRLRFRSPYQERHRMALRLPPSLHRILRWLIVIPAVLAGLSILLVVLYRVVPPPITPLMIIRSLDDDSLTTDVRREWRPLEDISPHALRAVLAAEDMKFCDHFGFDWTALRAAWQSYRDDAKGARLRGGSTITMQTAKNVFLWPSRSLFRKSAEAWFTMLMEVFWSKQRILEVYLNVVEWGDGIYGVEAAARAHFRRPAKTLTAGQAARLAAILPNPRIYAVDEPTGYIAGRARTILRRMRDVRVSDGAVCP